MWVLPVQRELKEAEQRECKENVYMSTGEVSCLFNPIYEYVMIDDDIMQYKLRRMNVDYCKCMAFFLYLSMQNIQKYNRSAVVIWIDFKHHFQSQ